MNKNVQRLLFGLVITTVFLILPYYYLNLEGVSTDCNSTCRTMNYQYGVCREDTYGCAPDELDLGKNTNGCVDANCCCVTGCEYMCKDRGYQSGYCSFKRECKEGEINLGSGICKAGWPTTAFTLCCCKSS